MDVMMLGEVMPFIDEYVEELSGFLSEIRSEGGLSWKQKNWLKFCLMGILITNSIKWSKFHRASLGKYKISALSWMLRCSKIFWEHILQASHGGGTGRGTKLELGIELLARFASDFPAFRVKGILADALYGSGEFADDSNDKPVVWSGTRPVAFFRYHIFFGITKFKEIASFHL